MICSPLIDCHFHLYPEDDTPAILARARAAGLVAFIATATDYEAAQMLCRLASVEADLYATVGIHPHEAKEFDGDIEPYRLLARSDKVVAIGEIGLDYYYDHSPRQAQKQVFGAFLKLAAEERLPAVVHCRDAYDDCFEMLQRHLEPGQRFLIHSYSGTPEWAASFLELGAYFSFNGMCTFKKADNIRAALQAVPLDRLLLETDAPYLAPVPHRGKRNEPAYLTEVLDRIARERGLSPTELARVTTATTREFFALPAVP